MPQLALLPNPAPKRSLPTDRRFIDETGNVYGRLTVVDYAGKRGTSKLWLCRCECNRTTEVDGCNLRRGRTRSCGCSQPAHISESKRRHGQSSKGKETTEYRIWSAMLRRCRNPNTPAFKDYGGRGIKVCERWHRFENFYADMGQRPSQKHTIDRIDNDGNYEPGNCRWVTMHVQTRNSRINVNIAHGGRVACLQDWANEASLDHTTLRRRLNSGMDVGAALAKPSTRRRK